jgi:hypothetical protein
LVLSFSDFCLGAIRKEKKIPTCSIQCFLKLGTKIMIIVEPCPVITRGKNNPKLIPISTYNYDDLCQKLQLRYLYILVKGVE